MNDIINYISGRIKIKTNRKAISKTNIGKEKAITQKQEENGKHKLKEKKNK